MYRVRWEIDVPADSPREAARKARACMLRPNTTATVFDVQEAGEKTSRIDLGRQEDAGTLDLLVRALTHAQRRLNQIPHRYDDTDFRLIRDAIRASETTKGEHAHDPPLDPPGEQEPGSHIPRNAST